MSYLDIVCETSYGKESVTKTGRLYIIFIAVLYSKQKKDDIEWWNRRLRVWIVVVERDYDGKKNRRGGGKTQQYTITITRTYNNTLITIWYWFGDMWFVFRELLTSSLPIWWISIGFLFFIQILETGMATYRHMVFMPLSKYIICCMMKIIRNNLKL